jgi:hypothetical protein
LPGDIYSDEIHYGRNLEIVLFYRQIGDVDGRLACSHLNERAVWYIEDRLPPPLSRTAGIAYFSYQPEALCLG